MNEALCNALNKISKMSEEDFNSRLEETKTSWYAVVIKELQEFSDFVSENGNMELYGDK